MLTLIEQKKYVNFAQSQVFMLNCWMCKIDNNIKETGWIGANDIIGVDLFTDICISAHSTLYNQTALSIKICRSFDEKSLQIKFKWIV